MRFPVLMLFALYGCGRSEVYRFSSEGPEFVDAGHQDECETICPVHAHHLPGAACACACDDGYLGDGSRCVSVAASLYGLRWELPCVSPWPNAPDYVCVSVPDTTSSVALRGPPDALYEVQLRVRGVVETKDYPGGQGDGGSVVRGGQPVDDPWNVYRLDISTPSQRWHLNQGPTGEYRCRAVDQRFTVQANGGARFTLFASTVDPSRTEIRNRSADGGQIVVLGIAPAPAAFDGQFLQLDVEAIRKLP